jgi:hypothetical protein
MKPAGAPTLFAIHDNAAVRTAVQGCRRSDGLNYRTDFVTACDRRCSREERPRKGIGNHA